MLKTALNEDERKIKTRFPKKSVFTEEKWQDTGRWEEILKEGIQENNGFSEQVKILFTPGSEPIKPPDEEPKLENGLTLATYGPREGGEIFEVLMATAVKAYEMVSAGGRNMSSMLTPITLMGSDKTNKELATSLGIPFKEIGLMLYSKY